MENKRKILLISDNFENFTTYLLKILAVKIMKANSCELIEINKSDSFHEYLNYEVPCLVLIRNDEVVDIISGFKYLNKVPIF